MQYFILQDQFKANPNRVFFVSYLWHFALHQLSLITISKYSCFTARLYACFDSLVFSACLRSICLFPCLQTCMSDYQSFTSSASLTDWHLFYISRCVLFNHPSFAYFLDLPILFSLFLCCWSISLLSFTCKSFGFICLYLLFFYQDRCLLYVLNFNPGIESCGGTGMAGSERS